MSLVPHPEMAASPIAVITSPTAVTTSHQICRMSYPLILVYERAYTCNFQTAAAQIEVAMNLRGLLLRVP
ncbi:hypothetical protein ACFL6C_01465 [Myxococcota bacterium]